MNTGKLNMNTTLNKIREYHPCQSGWTTLLNHLGKTKADDESIEFSTILEAVGIEDAIWCLQTQEYRDICLFNADVAESVLHIFENEFPDDDRPRLAIQAIRDWHSGKIDDEQLARAASAARYTASDAASDANYARYTARYAASTASDAASYYASASDANYARYTARYAASTARYARAAGASASAANYARYTASYAASTARYARAASASAASAASYASYASDAAGDAASAASDAASYASIEELFVEHFS